MQTTLSLDNLIPLRTTNNLATLLSLIKNSEQNEMANSFSTKKAKKLLTFFSPVFFCTKSPRNIWCKRLRSRINSYFNLSERPEIW